MSTGYYNETGKPFTHMPSRLGCKVSQETRQKLSIAHKGKKRPPFSDEWKQKISQTLKRRFANGELKVVISESHKAKLRSMRGPLSPNWKGGKETYIRTLRTRIEWRQWREKVFKRDDYSCNICGNEKDDVPLEIDHIIPISKGGTDEMDNLQTLCKDCNIGKSDRIVDYGCSDKHE